MQYNLICDLFSEQQADLHERALHYGDGLFETMLLEKGQIKFWPQHYQRLYVSANRLGIDCPARAWFEQHLQLYIELQQALVIKIILTRGNGGRGLLLPDRFTSSIYLLKYPYVNQSKQYVKAFISQITLSNNKNLAGLKHLNRLDYVLATVDLNKRQDYNEVLLINPDGHIIESIIHNLFFVTANGICTPRLDQCGVDGVMRQLIIKRLEQIGKNVKISNYTKQDILSAEECFLCNSVQGIRPVIQLEDATYGIGLTTKDLQHYFHGHSGN